MIARLILAAMAPSSFSLIDSAGTAIARPGELAARIKAIARKIREQSALMRDTVRIICRSSAIEELTIAVRDSALTDLDASKEIRDAAKELSEHEGTLTIIKTKVAKVERVEVSISPDIGTGAKENKQDLSPKASQSSIIEIVAAAKEAESKANQEAQQREQLINHAYKKSRKKRRNVENM
jgi:hypothetical protein